MRVGAAGSKWFLARTAEQARGDPSLESSKESSGALEENLEEEDLPLSVRRKRPVQEEKEEDRPLSKRKKSPEPDMEEEDLPLSKRKAMKRANTWSQEATSSLEHLLLPDEVSARPLADLT